MHVSFEIPPNHFSRRFTHIKHLRGAFACDCFGLNPLVASSDDINYMKLINMCSVDLQGIFRVIYLWHYRHRMSERCLETAALFEGRV